MVHSRDNTAYVSIDQPELCRGITSATYAIISGALPRPIRAYILNCGDTILPLSPEAPRIKHRNAETMKHKYRARDNTHLEWIGFQHPHLPHYHLQPSSNGIAHA
jgi:hypothetical protein